MIKIENLKLHFDSAFYLTVNELSLSDSGLFLIEGKNGSGKSTFLEVLAGRIKPESFSFAVDGKTLMNKELLQFQQTQIHFVHQNSLVFPELTCLENVLLPFYNPDKDKAMKCLKRVQLDKLANQKASQLSSGEKQRLSFCRVLYEHRPILLLDEITSNLDSESTNIIEDCIRELAATSLILFVTHENSTLSDYAECILFENGQIIKSPAFFKSENEDKKSEYKRKGWIKKGFLRNRAYFLTLSILSVIFLTCGRILNSFNDILGYLGNNPYGQRIRTDTYLEYSRVFFYAWQDKHDDEKPELIPNEYFFAYNSDISCSNPDIGSSSSTIAYRPMDCSFQDYNISLAVADNAPLGRLPENENEVLVSDYTYYYYKKQEPELSKEDLFGKIQNDFQKNVRMYNLKVVGIYKGLELNELDTTAINYIQNGYSLNGQARLFYFFRQDTRISVKDPLVEKDATSGTYFLLNTERNRAFRKKHRDQVKVRSIAEGNDFSGFVLPVDKDGYPSFNKFSTMGDISIFGVPLMSFGLAVALIRRISFVFRNKRKYLLLRSRGYKEKSLIQEDVFLHLSSYLFIVLSSFAISEIVLAIINKGFASHISTPMNRYYFSHSYLPFWICIAAAFLLTIVFFVLDRFVLVKINVSKEINQLKTK